MQGTSTREVPGRRSALGRLVAVTAAVVGLAAVALAPGIAGAAAAPRTASVISTAKNAKLGTFLVAGNTVYTLKPSKVPCVGKCLKAWPPVLLPDGVTSPTAGSGVDAAELGTHATSDGSLQITYEGKPLYWFAKDKKPGQVKGNVKDKWGKWQTVVTVKAHSGSTNTNTNTGTGGTAF